MESNFSAQIKTNDVAEAYDSNSQLFTPKEAIEIPSHPKGNKFSKIKKR